MQLKFAIRPWCYTEKNCGSGGAENPSQDRLEWLCQSVGLGTPWDPPGGARGSAQPRISRRKWMDGLRWKSSSRVHMGETLTHHNLWLQALWWSSALNEVPSWQMNGLLAEWHEDMNQRHVDSSEQSLWPMPCATCPYTHKKTNKQINTKNGWMITCMIYESLIFSLEKPDFRIYPEESHPWFSIFLWDWFSKLAMFSLLQGRCPVA